ncbi:uncharacterized protein PAC_08540 [Phialocephala subalpina]|uniref:Heterokaryon incompatibility domain-containing protein n=1 Tax=Phialocephala subalpina TaxID=576137 RepID=A0A1L7X0V2_9HELO|nr:uncharacterized protein PAC_08540 [Phialocephala subalpina]
MAGTCPSGLPTYTHQPLTGERNIRVLEAHGAESYDTALTFKLLEVSLDSPPEYHAISYCWEGQAPSRRVICEGKTLLVTVNCEAALKQFRRRQDETILLWIDAICINQSTEAVLERNQQVLMMGEVYSSATEVWVWLGTGLLRPLPDKVMAMLRWLRDLGEAGCESESGKREADVSNVALRMKAEDLCFLSKFIPWIERIWVVQEVVLSQRAKLHRDEVVIDYYGLILASEIITNAANTNTNLAHYYHHLSNDFKIFRYLEKIKAEPKPPSGSAVRDILRSSRQYLSSDPRDKVFALHSLLRRAGLSLPHPDYSKDTAAVYRETTKALLLRSGNPRILQQVNGLDDNLGLSSWSPNWHERTYPRTPHPPENRDFNASGSSCGALSVSGNDLLLVCRGRILETVSVCAGVSLPHDLEKIGEPEYYPAWSRNIQPKEAFWVDLLSTCPELSGSILRVWSIHVLQRFISFVSSTASQRKGGADAQQDLQACLIAYIDASSAYGGIIKRTGDWRGWSDSIIKEQLDMTTKSNPQDGSEIVRQGSQEGLTWIATSELFNFRVTREKLENSKAFSVLQTQEFQVWETLCRNHNQAAINCAVRATACYQTLFRTSSTNSLGMAPQSICEGDQIALLAGLEVPMIIRLLENGHYRVITPAYVCGMMYGEAWDESWEEGDGLQDLVFE